MPNLFGYLIRDADGKPGLCGVGPVRKLSDEERENVPANIAMLEKIPGENGEMPELYWGLVDNHYVLVTHPPKEVNNGNTANKTDMPKMQGESL